MKPAFQILRPVNLLIIFITQVFTCHFLIHHRNFEWFTDPGFWLLSAGTLSIAAAGYIINDLLDILADSINKPDKNVIGKGMTRRNAIILCYGLNIFAMIAGFLISPLFLLIFGLIIGLLILYSFFMKNIALAGNFLIALLLGFTVMVVWIREPETGFTVVFFYASFSFLTGLFREIVKDIEDMEGDASAGAYTLPVVMGIPRTKVFAFTISGLVYLAIIYFVTLLFIEGNYLLAVYFILFVFVPLTVINIQFRTAVNKADYSKISRYMKVLIFSGLISMILT